ncbi:MAG: hypothetical protein HC865_03625 [Cyanobacteria bacterium RU_5_0]|nr:hypothetical protein [Cyanobacteria bacterium RU_5_0]
MLHQHNGWIQLNRDSKEVIYLDHSAGIQNQFPQIAQFILDQCNLESFENATPIDVLFDGQPIQLINDTSDGIVARRLGYFFTLDPYLRNAFEEAFTAGIVSNLDIEIVSQQGLYRVQAEAQNIFDAATKNAIVRLSDWYVLGDYETLCTVSLTGIENEFSEVLLRAQYYATYGQALQPSVFQESATLALSSLISLRLQGEPFQSAEEVRVFLQDTLARSRRRYDRATDLPLSSPDQDSAFIAAWLNERLNHFFPTPFPDGQVEFTVDTSAGMGNIIRPVVVMN